jgi:hypothetical protein
MAGRELRLTVYSLFALSEETTIETVMGATRRGSLRRKFRRWFSDNGVSLVLIIAILAAAWLVA